jgi:uncharacterized membrane protein YgcG
MSFAWNLDTKLLRLGPNSYLDNRAACESILVWGGIGSGKTSATGKAIATSLLRAGWGGVVCVAKPEEIERWLDYAKQSGRSNSVICFDSSRGYNFLKHELARQGTQGLPNVVECLIRLLDIAAHATGANGKESDTFWLESIRQILNHAIPVLHSAGDLSVKSILDFVTTAATKPELYVDAQWVKANYAGQVLRRFVDAPARPLPAETQQAMLQYWIKDYTAIPEKTRGNMVISLTTKLDRFKHGRLARCFCDKTDILPEMTFHGALIILCMPALTWNFDGVIGQQLFKYQWMRTVETRNALDPSQRERGVFLFCDEAHYFANSYDETFISTSRGSRAAVIYMSQNLPTFVAQAGKDKSDAVESLIGKFSSQVFHSNPCFKTNKYAAELLGRGIQRRANESRSVGSNRSLGLNQGSNTNRGTSSGKGSSFGQGGASFNSNSGGSSGSGESYGTNLGSGTNEGQSWGTSEQMDYVVEPRVFAEELKTGGPAHEVTAIWFKAAGNFPDANGGNFLRVRFRQ